LTQLVKHSPIDPRRLLGIPPGKSAAAIAQAISAYSRNGFLAPNEAREKLSRMVMVLKDLQCNGFDQPCWGYHFDVQTRVFFYPRGAPNTIATAFAAQALLDAYEYAGVERGLVDASGAGDFFLRHIPQTETSSGAYFGYLVGDRTPIHNSNMLVAALLGRLWRHPGRREYLDAAEAALNYTLAHQRSDGSWPYGELPHIGWIDNFHTAYVLESLMTCLGAGLIADREADLDRGLAFYRQALFRSDGAPKYTSGSVYPIDIQCSAEAIRTFCMSASHGGSHSDFAWRVYEHAISSLRRADGAFIFQRRAHWSNRIAHIRWAAAPMLLALTELAALSDK
jgi:hypothetical protein